MDKLQQLQTRLKKLTTPPKFSKRDGIKYWQDRILLSVLAIGLILGFFVYVPSVALLIIEDLWFIAVADTIAYFGAFFLFFKRSLPFSFRAYGFIAISYLLALVLIFTVGPFGAGPVWLFFSPILTGLFLSARSTVISLIINTITVIALGLVLYFDIFEWRRAAGFPFESWAVIGLNFLFINILSAWTIVSVLNGLQNSLLLEKDALTSVEQKNKELQESNLKLQKEIDDRKRFELALLESREALEESELKFQDLVNMLPFPYFLLDNDLNLNYVNIQMLEMFNYPSENKEIDLPKNATDFLVSADRSRVEEDFYTLVKEFGNSWRYYTGLTSDGREIPIEILASYITINEKTVGVQGIILDITERIENEKIKKAKEIAEKTNKAISEWVNFIVHELRTPISALLQFSQLGLRKLNNTDFAELISELDSECNSLVEPKERSHDKFMEKYEMVKNQIEERERRFIKYFNRVYTGGYRLQRLLNELLDLSKLEAGKMQFEMKTADMMDIIKESCNEMEAAFVWDNLVLEMGQTNIPTELTCDAFRLGQVMRNLINNAIKFSTPGSKITISIKKTQLELNNRFFPGLHTTVSDQGVGIPSDQLEFVFSMFNQSRKTRMGEGSGLGLPICKQIISAHSGEIWATNDGSKGTQIHFVLPYEQPFAE